jgi:hypothetical protein
VEKQALEEQAGLSLVRRQLALDGAAGAEAERHRQQAEAALVEARGRLKRSEDTAAQWAVRERVVEDRMRQVEGMQVSVSALRISHLEDPCTPHIPPLAMPASYDYTLRAHPLPFNGTKSTSLYT